MKPLFEGIYTLFTADTEDDLYQAVSGRFYMGSAPQDATYPHIVYSLVSDMPDEHLSDSPLIEDILLQFSLYSQKKSASEVADMFTYLKAMFDDCIVTVSGYSLIEFTRDQANLIRDEENNIWHYAVDYNVILTA